MEKKPEIREEGDAYHIIIPKQYTTLDHLNVFVQNIVKSAQTQDGEENLQAIVQRLSKRWPDPARASVRKWADMRVLVIDDQATIRTLMKGALKDIGFTPENIDDANDGKPAIQKMLDVRFDLIISDWNMPLITGLDLLKIVKGVPGLSKTLFVMVTSQGHQKSVMEAIKYGIDGYIIKPFTTAHVEKTLHKIMGG